jgi:hypothetical protein
MTGIADVLRVLDAMRAPHALIGAHAMAARGYPRFTVDIDILTVDGRVLDRDTWTDLERTGAVVERRRGDPDDPLGGVVRIQRAGVPDVDVVLGKWKWEAKVIDRAEPVSLGGVPVRVPRLADLILLKLAAGGSLDLHDAAVLLTLGHRDALAREIEERLPDVRPDVSHAWRELLAGR